MPTEHEQKVLDSVPDKERYFTLAAHGNSQSIQYGESEKTLSARKVANIIRHNDKYNGEKSAYCHVILKEKNTVLHSN